MIQGPIYYGLRAKVLENFPKETRATLENHLSFGQWLKEGMFTVDSVTKRGFVLRAAPQDVASALLTDVELYSNHCFEQIQEIICFANDERLRSDAWNVVTIYYFSYFAANMFLRLIGEPVIFLKREYVSDLVKVSPTPAPTSGNRPAAGTYYLQKGKDISASQTEYELKVSNKKPHEATWKNFFDYINSSCDNSNSNDATELLIYKTLTTTSLFKVYQDYEWPSIIRSKANYTPGYAYKLLESQYMAKTKRATKEWKALDISMVDDILFKALRSCSPSDKTEYSDHVRFLHHTGQTIFIIARQLYLELIERRTIDPRWEQMRTNFREKMSKENGDFALLAQPLKANHPLFS
jgi:hypothetical protein